MGSRGGVAATFIQILKTVVRIGRTRKSEDVTCSLTLLTVLQTSFLSIYKVAVSLNKI